MNILCRLGMHRAIPSTVWNDGHYFSRCSRCGQDLIRAAGSRWSAVPPHLRVVWRPRTSDDIVWPDQAIRD